MHDFIQTISRTFSRAVLPALIVMAVGFVVLVVLYWRWYGKDGKEPNFPFLKRAVAILLLLCYLGGLAAITLLQRENHGVMGRGYIQAWPFLAFMEAWNAFTLQVWLNPLLNIAMFFPLGILLPLTAKPFRRWYWTLAAGLGASFAIETAQFFTGRGQADVDDLLCNTLGAMIGFCLCMAVIRLAEDRKRHAAAYAVLPALSAAALAGVFLVYQLQPYGNLADAPIFPADTSGTNWVLDCQLSDEPGPAGVYWAEPFTKASCDDFALDFARRRGVDINGERFDINYYDNTAYYSDHSTFCIIVNYNDCSYQYSDYRVDFWTEDNWGAVTEGELRAALEELGIPVPAAAKFSDEGKGRYFFHAANAEQDGVFYDGTIECRVAEGGALYQVDNAMAAVTHRGDGPVLSEREAYSRLCAGRFNQKEAFAFGYYAPHGEVHVTACELEYVTDSKGYRQPVYYFTLSDERKGELRGGSGWRVFVPALV